MSLQSSLDRLDAIINRRASAEEAEPDRADASLADARRQRQRANAERRNEIASTYDDAFRSFGTQVPEPVDDEPAENFRKRLFNRLARRLAPDHELAQIRADDVSSSPVVFDRFEVMLLDAAQQEGLKPSVENLPDDGMVMRVRADAKHRREVQRIFRQGEFRQGPHPSRSKGGVHPQSERQLRHLGAARSPDNRRLSGDAIIRKGASRWVRRKFGRLGRRAAALAGAADKVAAVHPARARAAAGRLASPGMWVGPGQLAFPIGAIPRASPIRSPT